MLVFCIRNVGASNQIKYVYSNDRTFIERIDFFDTESGVLIYSFDVYGNSPYEKLKFFADEKNDQGGKLYLSSKNTNFSNMLFKKDEAPYFTKNLDPIRAESYAYVDINGKKYAAITYAIVAFNSEREPISWKSSIYVIDNNGTIVNIFSDLDIDARSAVVTDNGKMMAFPYGGIVANDMDHLFPEGYQVYNLENSSILECYRSKEGEAILTPFVMGNKLFIESLIGYNPESIFFYRVFESEILIKLMRQFTYEERNSLLEILENGLKLERGGTNTIILFDKDFEITKL